MGLEIKKTGPNQHRLITVRGEVDLYSSPDLRAAILEAVPKATERVAVDLSGAHNQPPHDPAANLVYSIRASDVQTVICNGEVIMRDRQLLTLDLEEIKARVGESMARLSQRMPESRIQLYRP